jgi:hypothetical protein
MARPVTSPRSGWDTVIPAASTRHRTFMSGVSREKRPGSRPRPAAALGTELDTILFRQGEAAAGARRR